MRQLAHYVNRRSASVWVTEDRALDIVTVTQFENRYWYATELKTFAEMIRILSASVVGVITAAVTTYRRSDDREQLDAVSHQWISEHRLGQGQDSRR